MKQPNIHKMMIQLQHLFHNVKIPIKAQLGQLSTMNFSKIFWTDLMEFWPDLGRFPQKFHEKLLKIVLYREFVLFSTIWNLTIKGIVLSEFVLSGDPLYVLITYEMHHEETI